MRVTRTPGGNRLTRPRRFGEIDLVAAAGNAPVFVEARARRSDDYGGAGASITAPKRRRIVAAARHHLAALAAVPMHGAERRIEWLTDAFGE